MSVPKDDRKAILRNWASVREKRHTHFYKTMSESFKEMRKALTKQTREYIEKHAKVLQEAGLPNLMAGVEYGFIDTEYKHCYCDSEVWNFFVEHCKITYQAIGVTSPRLTLTPTFIDKELLDKAAELQKETNLLAASSDIVGRILLHALDNYGSVRYMLTVVPELKMIVPKELWPPDAWKPNPVYKVYSRDRFLEAGLDPLHVTLYLGGMSMEGCL